MQPNAQINAKKIQRRHRPSRQAYDPPRPSSQETPPIPGGLHTQRGVVSPPWTGFHLTQEWTAPSPHARATGSRRPASSHQCPEPLPALQTGAQTDWTTESKDFGFPWGQQRPLEKRGGPCVHLTLSTRWATPADARAGDLRDVLAGAPLASSGSGTEAVGPGHPCRAQGRADSAFPHCRRSLLLGHCTHRITGDSS